MTETDDGFKIAEMDLNVITSYSIHYTKLYDIPSRTYVPDVGVSRNPRIFMKVDFPEPEDPMIERNSPL